jgi:hypothetical protein
LGAQGCDPFLSKLGRGVARDQLQWVAGHKARQKEVDRNGQKESKAEFKGAAGKVFHH